MLKTQQIQQFLSSKQGTCLALMVAAVFLLLILGQIYTGVAFFFSKPNASATMASASAFVPIQRKPQMDLSTLNIFGKYEAVPGTLKDLPATNLNLHLDGVFVAVPKYLSQAIISVAGGEQKVFFVGDRIPGNATLYQVLDNRVIIQHNGELSNLQLSKNKLKFNSLPTRLNLPKAAPQPHRSLK